MLVQFGWHFIHGYPIICAVCSVLSIQTCIAAKITDVWNKYGIYFGAIYVLKLGSLWFQFQQCTHWWFGNLLREGIYENNHELNATMNAMLRPYANKYGWAHKSHSSTIRSLLLLINLSLRINLLKSFLWKRDMDVPILTAVGQPSRDVHSPMRGFIILW